MRVLLIIISTLILFILMSFLKKKKLSATDTIILPTIYMIFLSCNNFLKNYVLVVLILYLILEFFYLNLFNKKDLLRTEKSYYQKCFLTLLLGIITYYFFIKKVNYVYVDMEIFKNFLWLLIILYFLKKLNLTSLKLKEEEHSNFEERFQEYVVINYAKYKNKYGYLIKNKNLEIANLLYSFLIYESYLHGVIYQVFLPIKNKLFKSNTYGLIGVPTDHYVSREEAIVLMKEKLENKLGKMRKSKNKEDEIKKLINEKYKLSKDIQMILKILKIIENFQE